MSRHSDVHDGFVYTVQADTNAVCAGGFRLVAADFACSACQAACPSSRAGSAGSPGSGGLDGLVDGLLWGKERLPPWLGRVHVGSRHGVVWKCSS